MPVVAVDTVGGVGTWHGTQIRRGAGMAKTTSMVTRRGRWAVGGVLALSGVLVLVLDLLADPGRPQWWFVAVGLCLAGALVAQSARTRVWTTARPSSSEASTSPS